MGAGSSVHKSPELVTKSVSQSSTDEIRKLKSRIQELEDELEEKKTELSIVYEIDEIRDKYIEPRAMYGAIVELLSEKLRTELCLLYILDDETALLELWGSTPRSELLSSVSQHVKSEFLFKWLDENYESLTRTKEGAKIVVLGSKVLPEEFNLTGFKESLHILAIQIEMDKRKMGVLILCRKTQFTKNEITALKAAESQLDSAVVQAQAYQHLQLRNKELQAIYTVDHLRDEENSLDMFLESTINQLLDILGADVTYIMLYDSVQDQLKLNTTTDSVLWEDDKQAALESYGVESLKQSSTFWYNEIQSGPFRAIMCIPLILKEKIIGVFGALNIRSDRKFLAADRSLLKAIASQMDSAIYDNLESFRLRQVLGRSVDKKVMERILKDPKLELLKPERCVATVLFADLRNSTQLAENTDTNQLGQFINEFLGEMAQIVVGFQGTLDKFIGDEVMALFNVPFALERHELVAIQVAFKMREVHRTIMERWASKLDSMSTPIGIGIATGDLIVGEIGCALRTDYTAIGKAANMAARLTDACPGDAIWISEETYQKVADAVEATLVEGLVLKGITDARAYNVTSLKNIDSLA